MLYPSLQKKLFRVERSNEAIYSTIKDLLVTYKQLHDKRVSLRSLTFANIFVQQNKLRLLRSVNLIENEELEIQHLNRRFKYQTLEPMEFNPPEIFERGWSDCKADIWALGTLIFKLVNGYMPWNHRTYDFNLQIKAHYMEPVDHSVPEKLKNLLKKMLEIDPMQRINIDEVFINEWVQENSMVYKFEDSEIERRIKANINEQKSGWNWLKTKMSESVDSIGTVGLWCGAKVKEGGGMFGSGMGSVLKRTFLCYEGEEDLARFEKERRDFERRYEFDRHASMSGMDSGPRGVRNLTTKGTSRVTDNRGPKSRNPSAL